MTRFVLGINSYLLAKTAITNPALAAEAVKNASGIKRYQLSGEAKNRNSVSPAKSQMDVSRTNAFPFLSQIFPQILRSTTCGRERSRDKEVTVR